MNKLLNDFEPIRCSCLVCKAKAVPYCSRLCHKDILEQKEFPWQTYIHTD